MRNFVYVIGNMTDFGSLEAVKDAYFNGDELQRVYSAFPVTLDEGCKVQGYNSLKEIATMIGRGEAMAEGWYLYDTFSDTIEVE